MGIDFSQDFLFPGPIILLIKLIDDTADVDGERITTDRRHSTTLDDAQLHNVILKQIVFPRGFPISKCGEFGELIYFFLKLDLCFLCFRCIDCHSFSVRGFRLVTGLLERAHRNDEAAQ